MNLSVLFAQYETKYKNLWLVIKTAIIILMLVCVSMHFYLVGVGQDFVTAQTSPAGDVNENTLTLLGQQELFRSRVSSAHMRQLSNFIISKRQLQLVETLGQGWLHNVDMTIIPLIVGIHIIWIIHAYTTY